MINPWERAKLYLLRKKNKSIILLAILTVIASLVLTCIAIDNAAETAAQKLRETIGGYFKIATDTERGYTQPVDDNLVQAVMDLEGIKSYNGLDIIYLLTDSLSLTPGHFTVDNDPKAKLARFIGNTDSSLNEYFVLRSFSLTEGRHIKPDDIGKGLISKELSQNNNLSIGDTFTAALYTEDLSEKQKGTISPYNFEIVGIYDINTTQSLSNADSAECDIADNFIFVDTTSIRRIYEPVLGRKINSYKNGAAFFLKDPKELDAATAQLATLTAYDWNGYKITKNNEAFNRSAAPLARISSLITMIVIILALISIVLLSLILAMWMRDRMYEIGILMSVGMKKVNIIGQHILENLLIASIALLLAWGVANISADRLGDMLFVNANEDLQAPAKSQSEYTQADVEAPEIDTESLVQIHVGGREFLQVVEIGYLIVMISTVISSGMIIKMKPKDILSTMS
ncbi:MAG: ABC transporter permease [Blautia sp.]|jgi:putative ABC transport system permease protein